MNTKILMRATVMYLGLAGFALSFLPHEIANFFEARTNQTLVVLFQMVGALYLGFAMMNWMSKNSRIGGIYNRPIAFGNFLHFLITAFALIKVVGNFENSQFIILLTVTIVYSIFTISFGFLLKSSPVKAAHSMD